MSLNYKNVTLIKSESNDGFVEIKKNNKKKNTNIPNSPNEIKIVSTPSSIQSYNKDYINEIINEHFDLEYSNSIIDAKIDIENQMENEFYLKTKYPVHSNSKSLNEIIKYHSAHYYRIKQDVHKNKSKYL